MSDPRVVDGDLHETWWEQRAEAFAEWAQNVDPADLTPLDTRALQRLSKLAAMREDVDEAIVEAVREARRQRSTWAEVGAMLGVTKQAAQQRFAPLLDGDERLTADRHLAEAYGRLPEDPALVESAARLAAHTATECADDAEDRRELDAARAEDDYLPWDEVKAAPGLESSASTSNPTTESIRDLPSRLCSTEETSLPDQD